MQYLQHLIRHQFEVYYQNFIKSVKNIGEHGVLVTSCFAILGQKPANVWKLLQWRGLKEGPWKQKTLNWALYKMSIADFCLFPILPQTQHSDFYKLIPTKYKILELSKKGIYVLNINTSRTYHISKQCLYFQLCNSQKPGECDDNTFLKRYFWYF